MPIGATIGAIGAIGGGLLASSAAKKAANTQSDAAVQAAQLQTAASNRAADMQLGMFNTIRGDLGPYRDIGSAAVNPYMNLLGISTGGYYAPPTTAPAPTGAAPAGLSNSVVGTPASPDWNAYLSANPDVMNQFNALSKNNLKNNYGITTPQQFAEWHYNTTGKNEGRQLAMIGGTTPEDAGATPDQTVAPQVQMTPEQQAAWQAQNSANIQASLENLPGYQFAKQQGIQSTTNALAAKGLGGAVSGAYAKGIARFVTGLADSTYGEQLSRLQSAVGIGQSAANQTGAFGQGATSNAGNAIIGGANAGAAGTVGAANAGAAGTIGSANAIAGGLSGAANAALTSRALGMYPTAATPNYGGVSPAQYAASIY